MARRFSVEAVFKARDNISAPVSRMQNRIGRMTRSMTRGLRTTNRVVGQISASLRSGLRRGAFAATAAIASLGVSLNKVTTSADELAKQSRLIDFPIEDLQEWRFAAEQSGVSADLLDKSLGTFSKRLGEAKIGMGPLASGLSKINPELLEQLTATESLSDAFDIYIGAIRASESATERAIIANAAFSRSGIALGLIADESAEAIEALRLEQRANGVITMAQANAAEAYGDAMNSLSHTMAGFIRSVLLPMVPKITELVLVFRSWLLVNREIVSSKILEFGRLLVDNFSNIVKWAKRIGIAIGAFFALSAALKAVAVAIAVVNVAMSLNPLGLIIIAIAAVTAGIILLVRNWDTLKDSMLGFAEVVTSKVMGALSGLRFAASLMMISWAPVADFFVDLWGGVVRVFESSMDSILPIIDRVLGAVSKVTGALSAVGGVAGGIGERFGSIRSGIGERFGALSSGVGDFISGGPETSEISSPQERIARSIEETRSTSMAEVTIKDETGRAEVTSGGLGPGLTLQRSGSF
jgi:hypothetical protein